MQDLWDDKYILKYNLLICQYINVKSIYNMNNQELRGIFGFPET